MQPSPKCSIEVDLAERLNHARKLYAASVRVLDDSDLPAHDDGIFDQVEAARLLYIVARNALLDHRKEHGCS
jgi:hypothetical protein